MRMNFAEQARTRSEVPPAILGIYSSRDRVPGELANRWTNPELAQEISAFLEGHVPPSFARAPRAVLSRHVATPDNEFNEFIVQSRRLGLSPLHVEFPDDLFTTNNRGEVSLVKMTFHHGVENSGNARITHLRVVDDVDACQNQPLMKIRTRWGEPLVGFHHRILREFHATEVHDASRWIRQFGIRAHTFYPKYLAMVSMRHVLFENFEPGREERFFHDIMLPSMEMIQQRFGLKPLILPIAPAEEMHDVFWWSYPEEVKPLVVDSM